MDFSKVEFSSYETSVPEALDQIGAGEKLAELENIIVKPNLVVDSPFPITTSPECCAAVIEYIQAHSKAKIVLAEGCGDMNLDTPDIFRSLGFDTLEKRYGIELMDLNTAPLKKISKPECPVFPEMYLPEIAFTHYIVSVPVLKAHSLAEVTGTLKNMMGFAPPEHYGGRFGSWKKATFHGQMHQSILDLNVYRTPDLSVLDASVGLADFHLGGAQCNPPVNKILAGFDPIAIDREAASLLGFNWRDIAHLC